MIEPLGRNEDNAAYKSRFDFFKICSFVLAGTIITAIEQFLYNTVVGYVWSAVFLFFVMPRMMWYWFDEMTWNISHVGEAALLICSFLVLTSVVLMLQLGSLLGVVSLGVFSFILLTRHEHL